MKFLSIQDIHTYVNGSKRLLRIYEVVERNSVCTEGRDDELEAEGDGRQW